ncbi:MAG: hypoxanthine phosphoribosyltransferase [Deltaproteobacteria bacterium]|nr:hypoxanthine phosphoribosyltransferase [Deltaproteobacteria bacterium]
MPILEAVFDQERIQAEIKRVAGEISSDYKGRELALVGVLKGAFIFLADLVRNLTIPAYVDFVRVSSYGDGTQPSGNIRLSQDVTLDLDGKDVLLVEDIVDTGHTMAFLLSHFSGRNAASVACCALVDKTGRRSRGVDLKYSCLSVAGGFLVGCGLDYAEKHRGLPGIYSLKP